MRSTLLVVTGLLLAGCSGYKNDVEAICNARTRAHVSADAGQAEQAQALAAWLMLNVHTPKAKRLFATMGSKTPAEKAAVLAREAKSQGVAPCPLAEEFGAPK
jgi:hypothetical protein